MISNKTQLAEYGIVAVTIAFLLTAMYFIPPRLTGLAVIPPGASAINLTPTAAIDNLYIEQVSPDNGANDGTVDASNNDARWLTSDGDNINVTAWDQAIPETATVNNVTASCEIDFVNQGEGELSFSWWTGATYSSWICPQHVSTGGSYTCNLFANGLDTPAEVNNARLRCRVREDGPPKGPLGFSIDAIKVEVVYTITTTSTSTSSTSTTTPTSTSTSSTSTSTTSSSTSTSSTSTSTTSTSTSTSTTSTSSTSTSTSTSTTTSSTSSTSSSSTSSTSTSTSSISSSTSTSTSSTTIEPETSVGETSNNRRRETTTIQPLETSTPSTTIQPEITEVTTEATTTQLATTSILPATGQFALAGRAITNNIVQPEKNRLLILALSILGLIYIYYRQTRKHFPRKAHINELKKGRKRGYYK